MKALKKNLATLKRVKGKQAKRLTKKEKQQERQEYYDKFEKKIQTAIKNSTQQTGSKKQSCKGQQTAFLLT